MNGGVSVTGSMRTGTSFGGEPGWVVLCVSHSVRACGERRKDEDSSATVRGDTPGRAAASAPAGVSTWNPERVRTHRIQSAHILSWGT